MRKTIVSLFLIVVVISLTACSKKDESKEENKTNIPLPVNVKGRAEEELNLKTNYTYKL